MADLTCQVEEAVEEGILHRRKPQLKQRSQQECAGPVVQAERGLRPKGVGQGTRSPGHARGGDRRVMRALTWTALLTRGPWEGFSSLIGLSTPKFFF